MHHRINPDTIRKEASWSRELENAHDNIITGLSAFHINAEGVTRKTCDLIHQVMQGRKWSFHNNLYLPQGGKEVGANQRERSAAMLHNSLRTAHQETALVMDIHRQLCDEIGVAISTNEIPSAETMQTTPFVRSMDENIVYPSAKDQDQADYYHYHIDQLDATDPTLPYKATSNAIQWHVSHPNPDVNFALNVAFQYWAWQTYNRNNQGHKNFPMGEIRGPARLQVARTRRSFQPPQSHRRIIGKTEPQEPSENYLGAIDDLYFDGQGIVGVPATSHNVTVLKKPGGYTTEIRPHKAPQTEQELKEAYQWIEHVFDEALTSDYAKALSIQSVSSYNQQKTS